MQNQRGFIGVGVLIAILVGLAVLGGSTYYVVHQKQQSAPQSSSDNLDNVEPLPTTNTKTKQTQSSPNTPAQAAPSSDVFNQKPTASNSKTAATISVSASDAVSLCSALTSTPFIHTLQAGDTDATTNGEVSRLQKLIIALDAKDYPQVAVTGIYDAATQAAIASTQKQSEGLQLKSSTGQMLSSDLSGVFGPATSAMVSLVCAFAQAGQQMSQNAAAISTTQQFPIPWLIWVRTGETATSVDGKYKVRVASTNPDSDTVDVIVTANGQQQESVLARNKRLIVGGFAVRYRGSDSTDNQNYVSYFSVSGPMVVATNTKTVQIPGSITLTSGAYATGNFNGQPIVIALVPNEVEQGSYVIVQEDGGLDISIAGNGTNFSVGGLKWTEMQNSDKSVTITFTTN